MKEKSFGYYVSLLRNEQQKPSKYNIVALPSKAYICFNSFKTFNEKYTIYTCSYPVFILQY